MLQVSVIYYDTASDLGSEVQVRAEESFSDNFAPAAAPLVASRQARASSALLSDGSIRNKAFRLGTAEHPSATLLKEFLGPVVVVLSLLLCLKIDGARLSVDSAALGFIVFLVANRILSTPATQTSADAQQHIRPTPPSLSGNTCSG